MDIYAYLKKDHQKVSNLLKEIETSPISPNNSTILETSIKELTLHAEAEQAIFYKAIKKTSKGKDIESQLQQKNIKKLKML